ncbi:unnamed protein product [Candida verbasci]|uniref:Kinesin-like protein n=1 Tax=Candida verbasci TaxID=1227364 RepID=A0A9W4XCB6_9ASCO|nr:unnamed protein product [Candida verbasci]
MSINNSRSFQDEDDDYSNQSLELSNESINHQQQQSYNLLSPSNLSRISSAFHTSLQSGSLSPSSPQIVNNIKVICRFRPENEKEVAKGKSIVTFPNSQTVTINGKDYINHYTFDRVFEPNSSQLDIYEFSINDIVDDLLNGYNGTILAYGQTGSGKTYTMLGTNEPYDFSSNEQGIIPRISNEIFKRINMNESNEIEYNISISFLEIYMEQIKDLIEPNIENEKFSIVEDKIQGMYVKGLTCKEVNNELEFIDVLNIGLKNRSISNTDMNEESSRSHTIFQIKLIQKDIETEVIKRSSLFLVDLAGSEKIDKTGAQGQTLKEAKKINSSLSALGNVINSLTDGKSTHIPYRDSKLTRILQESLGGNSRTSLIINCSPSSLHELETLSTLRFGTRAKTIKNVVHINTEVSQGCLKNRISQLEKINDQNHLYIKQLEEELASQRLGFHHQHSASPSMFSLIGSGATTSTTQSLTRKLSKENLQSRIPQQSSTNSMLLSSPSKNNVNLQLQEELERRDRKIEELENMILNLKMANLKNSHQEESKLFSLENTLHNISNKLAEVELVNINLRKHLLISEKIIESRDNKINKLKSSLKDQQLLISKETLSFRNRLGEIQNKLEQLNTYKQQEVDLKRQSLLLQQQQQPQQQPTPVDLVDDTQIISDINPDPDLIDSFDENSQDQDQDVETSNTLVETPKPSKKISIISNQTDNTSGFSIYSSKKLDDLPIQDGSKIINFQQEYISISEFLKESKRRSLLVSNPIAAITSTSPDPITDMKSSDTSGMFSQESDESKSKKDSNGLNLNIVKPLKSAGLFHTSS